MREQWTDAPLEGLVTETILGTTSRSVDGEGDLRLLKMGSIRNGAIDYSQTEVVSSRDIENPDRLILRSGDMVLNTRNTPELVGKVGVWREADDRTVPDNNLLIIRFKRNINSDYVAAQLTAGRPSRAIRQIAIGTTSVAAVYWRDVRKLRIPTPPTNEQQRIAEILETIDSLLRACVDEIDKLSRFKVALRRNMIRGISREERMCDLGEIVTGATPPAGSEYWGEGLPFVTPAELGESPNITRAPRSVTKRGQAFVRKIPRGSLLAVCIGFSYGKLGISSVDLCTNQQINCLIPREGIVPYYLYYALEEHVDRLRRLSGLQVTPIVNKTLFGSIRLPVPTLDMQQAVADGLGLVQKRISLERDRSRKLMQLKQGLRDDLLTGRVRVDAAEAVLENL